MGGHVAPPIHGGQLLQARLVRRVGRQVQREAETEEVLPQVLDGWITAIEGPMGVEVVLDQWLKSWPHLGSDDLGGLGGCFRLA